MLGAFCIVFLIFQFFGDSGLIPMYRSYRHVQLLQKEITEMNQTIDSLRKRIHHLENDTAFIEQYAREHLGMAKPGERVYKFIGEEK